MQDLRGYVICAMPRSGSYYLCELLTSTAILGRPTEYLNPEALRTLGLSTYVDDARARMRQAMRLSVTDNGVYGLKLLAYHFDHYTYANWIDDLPKLKFVYLVRDDLLGQALSLARGKQTQKWTSAMTSVRSDRESYDAGEISSCLNELVLDEARWRAFFARNDIWPLRASYEDLLADPQRVVCGIASMLGLGEEPRVDPAKLKLEVLRDDMTASWRSQFLAERADLSYLDSNRISLQLTKSNTRLGTGTAANTGKKLVVWGTGSAAQTTIAQRFDIASIDFFIDIDAKKHGQEFLGLPIRPPEALLDVEDCIVLISSEKNEDAIRRVIDDRFSTHVRRVVTLSEVLVDPRARVLL